MYGNEYFSCKVDILKIVDMSFPIFVEFELVDFRGIRHHFIDKAPVISADYNLVPHCIGYMRCRIISETDSTFVIDTSAPDDIESLEGYYQFEVNKEQLLSL